VFINVVTLFPDYLRQAVRVGILERAVERELLHYRFANPRDFAADKHGTVDDYPYGGDPGMIMMASPMVKATESLLAESEHPGHPVILLSPRGRRFDQEAARRLSREREITLLCGRYKGVDERVTSLVTHEVSVGDYVLTGGELGAMVIVDAVSRLVPGVLGDIESAETDSHFDGLLGPPVYTRPEEYQEQRVPDVLLSGNHEVIRLWRRKAALRTTRERRPDLLEAAELTDEDKRILDEIENEGREENTE
jgi:tRNA (guanine37-N1)-methyltransferase